MKLRPIVSVTVFTASLAFSMSALASGSQPEPAPRASQQTQATQKGEAQMQAGVQDPQKSEKIETQKINPAKDRSRHYHPRDGKT